MSVPKSPAPVDVTPPTQCEGNCWVQGIGIAAVLCPTLLDTKREKECIFPSNPRRELPVAVNSNNSAPCTVNGKPPVAGSMTDDGANASTPPPTAKVHIQMERQGFTLTIVNWFILDTATAPAISIPTKHPLLSLRPNITLYSLWDYTQAELEVTEYESTMAVPLERIASFLQIPWCLEKLLFIGSVVCLDSFLHAFTILPTQIAMAFRMLVHCLFLPAVQLGERVSHCSCLIQRSCTYGVRPVDRQGICHLQYA